ncbi:MAG: family 78 glycoside hydrolase catalytic domain, partial [Lachnospiraceae bacterium]|nr:family 78 glycoside hydrolase catalytic domain [Lachnospiraceae bacterium]
MAAIYDLKVNGMKNPLGTDEKIPVFSWKLSSDEKGVMQENYQIQAAKDESFEKLVWDSGKVSSDRALGIKYEGSALEASTRYYWRVRVQAKGQTAESKVAWFETGLMGTDASVWNGAKWIGSPKAAQNTDGVTTYAILADVQTEDRAGIVLAARNKDNYVLVETDIKNQLVKVYEYCDNAWDGSCESGVRPTVTVRGEKTGYAIPESAGVRADSFNRLFIEVDGTAMTVKVNDVTVMDCVPDIIPNNPPNQPRKAFMMMTGLKQCGNRAVYDKLEIRGTKTGDIYQSDDFSSDKGVLSALGRVEHGQLVVEDEFQLIDAVPSVNVRKLFRSEKKVAKARLYASAMGVYDVYLNGRKVNASFLNPGFTDYRKRISYQTYDVTELLTKGENVLGAVVAKGYYTGYVGYTVFPMVYGEQNTFIGRLVITYEDGSVENVVTDESWQFTDKGAVLAADFQQGEYQDARLSINWMNSTDGRFAACKAYAWPSEVIPTNGTLKGIEFELSAQEGPSAVTERILVPGRVTENPKGHFVYDFGQNMVGTVRLKLKGKRGTSIKLRYGEMSYKNGELYIANLRPAANTDVYVFRGDEEGEEFLPSFTFHGFRYMEITGNGCELTRAELDNMVLGIEGLVLTNVTSMTGSFSCSNESINKLQSNIEWGQRGNTLMVFTDCPQRNERMGWTGDAQVFAATAAYNMDIQSFMNK